MINCDLACKISDQLLLSGEKTYALPDGSLVTREDCQKVIDGFNTLPQERICLRCGDKLEVNDDLICGYHHLED